MSTVLNNEQPAATCACSQPASETARQYVKPAANILETPEGYVLEAALPGTNKDGLTLTVEDNVLTIVGRRQAAPSGQRLYQESSEADYRRVFELDASIDTGRITAHIKQGYLTVTLPRAEAAKPRKVEVN